ncbi:F-box only protein 6-like [Suncus etruscus]|uniref:F-box only protein 6-like n=1 Tax=Suncus etruscus TaxID=109475 RepID=UPI0021104B38|nr:F-box only protein 6-like [Suncus etruscus]
MERLHSQPPLSWADSSSCPFTHSRMCLKSQLVDLKANGYWDELLDHYRPDIVDPADLGSVPVTRPLSGDKGLGGISQGSLCLPALGVQRDTQCLEPSLNLLPPHRFAPCGDCEGTYLLSVNLTTEDLNSLAYFQPPPVTFHQWNDAKWREVSHTFSDYPPGVRYVLFQHGGRDTQNWAGWYGPRVTNNSVTVSPTRRTLNPTPKGTA